MALSRRLVLKYGLAGAAVLVAGGVGVALQGTVMRQPARALRVLGAQEYSILAALADRIAPGASDRQVAEKIDDLLAISEPELGAELQLLLRFLENALPGVFFEGQPRPFTARSPEAQDETLRAWRSSALTVRRTGYRALQALVLGTYYADPQTYAQVGYPGPPDFSGLDIPEPLPPGALIQ